MIAIPPSHWNLAVFWTCFSIAAVIFVLDATTTMHVAALQPMAVEQNPIARWAMELHPIAPYALKAAVVAICAGVACTLRAMDEPRWAFGVVLMMAFVGITGIATGLQVVRA